MKELEQRIERLEKLVRALLERQYPGRSEEMFNDYVDTSRHFQPFLRNEDKE